MNDSIKEFLRGIVFVGTACAMTACAGLGAVSTPKLDPQAESVASSMTTGERAAFERLYHEGERNAVLNFNELGVAALEANNFVRAEIAFSEATSRINRIYANDENTRKAKSVWSEEKVKDFKGEPYERAMTFYYRGLLYLNAGDYQNARASFLTAEYQDTVAEKEEFQGDFGLMNYLAAWSSYCDGDAGKVSEFLGSATKSDPSLVSLKANNKAIALLETGQGPAKQAAGANQELLTFSDRPSSVDVPTPIGAQTISRVWTKVGDTVYQATTRGGRPIQAILNGKVQWKEGTGTVGTALQLAGVTSATAGLLSNNDAMAQFGAYGSILGSLLSVASNSMQTGADTRTWVSLPRDIYVAEVERGIPQNVTSINVSFSTQADEKKEATLLVLGEGKKCSFLWGRTRTGLIASDQRSIEVGRDKRDPAFKAQLVDLFAAKESKL